MLFRSKEVHEPNKRFHSKKYNGPIFYGPLGLCSFLTKLLPNSYASAFDQQIGEEIERKFTEIIKTQAKSPVNPKETKAPLASTNVLFLNDFNEISAADSISRRSHESDDDSDSEDENVDYFSVDDTHSPQFYLYVAFYYTRYKKHSYEIVKTFIKANKAVKKSSLFHTLIG